MAIALLKIIHHLICEPIDTLFESVRAHGTCPQELTKRPDEIGRIARLLNRCLNDRTRHEAATERAHSRASTELYRLSKDHKRQVVGLQRDAYTDELTKLPNRACLEAQGPVMCQNALDESKDLSIIMIDVDKFKEVNDTMGHGTGDEVIRFTGQLLHSCTRQIDLPARFGGDEFVILLNDCSLKTAQSIGEKLRKLFRREVLQIIDTADGYVDTQPGLSIGIASLANSQAEDFDALFKLADKALYRAKESGRNCVAV